MAFFWRSVGGLGMAAVALGALGAHALKAQLATRGMTEVWNTAVLYHLVHTVALLCLGVLASQRSGAASSACWPWVRCAGAGWGIGCVLFSGSLYLLALGGPRWLGPITPLGGVALLFGWGAVVWGAGRGLAASDGER